MTHLRINLKIISVNLGPDYLIAKKCILCREFKTKSEVSAEALLI